MSASVLAFQVNVIPDTPAARANPVGAVGAPTG